MDNSVSFGSRIGTGIQRRAGKAAERANLHLVDICRIQMPRAFAKKNYAENFDKKFAREALDYKPFVAKLEIASMCAKAMFHSVQGKVLSAIAKVAKHI